MSDFKIESILESIRLRLLTLGGALSPGVAICLHDLKDQVLRVYGERANLQEVLVLLQSCAVSLTLVPRGEEELWTREARLRIQVCCEDVERMVAAAEKVE